MRERRRRALEPVERLLAKQRQIELGKTHGKAPLSPNERKGETRDIVASKVGLKHSTYERAKFVDQHADVFYFQEPINGSH